MPITRHTYSIFGVLALGLTLIATVASIALADGDPARKRDRATVSPIIFPPQSLPLRFSHVLHLENFDVSCDDCHENITESDSSLDNNLPREDSCEMCHSIDRQEFDKDNGPGKAPGNCAACHVGFDSQSGSLSIRPLTLPIPNLKFSHKRHLDRKAACATCHGDLAKEGVTLATREQLPRMRVCLQCHNGKTAPSKCSTCHLSNAGVIRTEYAGLGSLRPSGELRGAAHGMKFRDSHKYAAQNDKDFCASCHKKDFCVECHNGVRKPMDFHIGDYVAMHQIDARRNSPDCSSCHRIQTFCQGCHSRLGVAGDGKGPNGVGRIEFHPAGWAEIGLAGRGPNHHSFQAQRNIKQCASCHRENFCTRCHSNQSNSRSINPHPRNWMGSRRCEALLKRSKRMCLRCHIETRSLSCVR